MRSLASNRHALALSAGKLARFAGEQFPNAQDIRRFLDPALDILFRGLAQFQAEG